MMFFTPEARFARIFLRSPESPANGPTLAQAQVSMAQAQQQPAPIQVSWVNQQGQQVQAPIGVSPQPIQNAPQQGPAQAAVASQDAPAAGMSTTAKVAIGGAAFLAVYLLMRKRKG